MEVERSDAVLSKQERRLVEFADQDPLFFATNSAAAIAKATSTSEATVARAAKKLGFSGTKEMKLAYARKVETTQTLSGITQARLEALNVSAGNHGADAPFDAVLSSAVTLLLRLKDMLDPYALAALSGAIADAKRVLVYGLGTAFHISQYLCLELRRLGIQASELTGSGHTNADAVYRVTSDDILLVLAPRRIFPDVQNFLSHAAPRALDTTVVTPDDLPRSLADLRKIDLPLTFGEAASESVTAWAFCDVLIAEQVRRRPEEALGVRTTIQELRENLSP
ncbi:MurR/RpiR family transcriptional regulator [Brevibacterium sp. SMBL_HHYL_HB1]|uniref:MurR/RpiR family transcriptional regulator n=1 Tax=Brevibacterium sp. SMBL_HHYL_HB1 TaxID=2777556 RepID=UPI001BA78C57|nr:MurR/RpiR family transcriptional regulator [Brevibacterium sp. SMBL_HHYL_HB1]QUL80658.1 MurR/RpiR family transcriptional regulator [Brevibacterium sp. SMBL_HHYL_HB1]